MESSQYDQRLRKNLSIREGATIFNTEIDMYSACKFTFLARMSRVTKFVEFLICHCSVPYNITSD